MRAGDRPPRCQSSARRDQSANRHAQGPSVRAAPRGQASDAQSGRATLRNRRHNDLSAGVMDIARAARERKFARWPLRGGASEPSRCLKEKETKRRLRHVRPGLLSDRRRAASARDHGGEAEFAASDSYCGRHDDHAWCRKFESALHHGLENPAAMRDFGPRDGETRTRTGDTTIFSRAVWAGRRRAIPGNHAILRWPELQLKSAIYELLHAVQEMEASHLLLRRRFERRGRRSFMRSASDELDRT